MDFLFYTTINVDTWHYYFMDSYGLRKKYMSFLFLWNWWVCHNCTRCIEKCTFRNASFGMIGKSNALDGFNFATSGFLTMTFKNTLVLGQLMTTSFPGVFLKYVGHESRNDTLGNFMSAEC